MLVAAIVATRPGVQTWAAQRLLLGRPELGLTVGHVEFGWRRHEAGSVVWRGSAGRVELPRVTAEFPLWSAWRSGRLDLTRLEAEGVTFFVADPERNAGNTPAPVPHSGATAAGSVPAAQAPAAIFPGGGWAGTQLPFAPTVGFLRLTGKVILPEGRGAADLTLSGGGLTAEKAGKFDLIIRADFRRGDVERLEGTGAVTVALESPRSFGRVALELRAVAAGPRIGADVAFAADLSAAREADGEAFAGRMSRQGHRVLALDARRPRGASALQGNWQIDADDRDLAPLALGRVWPRFALKGAGTFTGDPAGKSVQFAGRVEGPWSRLETIRPELGALGEVRLQTAFDGVYGGGRLQFRQLEADIRGGGATANAAMQQPVAIDLHTGETVATDPMRPVARLAVTAAPAAWVAPWLPAATVTGGEWGGEIAVLALADGVSFRSVGPLRIEGVSVAQGSESRLEKLTIATEVAVDVAARGWQAELAGFRAELAGKEALTGDGRIGRLRAAEQALKLEGKVQGKAAEWLRQPWAGGWAALGAGELKIEYAASLGTTVEVRAKAELSGGEAKRNGATVRLPAVAAELKADIGATGQILLELPLALELDGRRSDLNLRGRIDAGDAGSRRFDLQVTGKQLHLNDAVALGAVRAAEDGKPEVPWRGLEGTLRLQLEKVVAPDATEVTGVEGTLRVENDELVLETGRLGWTNGASATAEGRLTFGRPETGALRWSGAVAVQDFDPTAALKRAEPRREPTVEGRFDLAAKASGRAESWSGLGRGVDGEFSLASRGGVFRGLPISAGNVSDSTSTIAALLASAGNMIGGIAGRRDNVDVANRSQAIGELAKSLGTLAYDQLSAKGTWSADRVRFDELVVIAPEVRLSGQGTMSAVRAADWWDETIEFEYRLRARGRTGELLRYLGLLEATRDELGYAAGSLDLGVGGTVAAVDAGEASRRLVAAALAKAGFIDKAAEWLARSRAGRAGRGADGGGESGK